jgi:hypothetical protein
MTVEDVHREAVARNSAVSIVEGLRQAASIFIAAIITIT